jgi:histidinol-phosphate aminotransferase
MSRFWSDHVHRLSPYVPGEQPKSAQLVKLNTNENPYPPSPRALAVLSGEIGAELRRYPDPNSHALRTAVAESRGLSAEQAFAGNGSDEVLALAFAAFFGAREGADGPLLFPDVSYSFYPVWADFFGIAWERVPLADDFTLDLGPYREGRGGIVFPNPNAPTGIAISVVAIEALLQAAPDRVVVVDEAYIEFGAESAAPLVSRHDNLLVVQTLSKSHALAGLRVGFAFGSPELIEGLDRVKNSFNSYPVDRIAERIACEALADRAWLDDCRNRIIATREWTSERLRGLGFEVLPSSANFVFARHGEVPGAKLFEELRAHDILVRHFAQPRIDDHLRITIGTDDEMKQLISLLESLLGG